MLNFKEYLEEQAKKPKYVEVRYNAETQKKLREWANANGFDLTVSFDGTKQAEEKFDFHTTIFYTTSLHDISNGTTKVKGSAKIVGIDFLGLDKDVPVLKIQSNEILAIRKEFTEKYGMKDKWPSYIPHVSLSYVKEPRNTKKMVLPTFTLNYDELRIADAAQI